MQIWLFRCEFVESRLKTGKKFRGKLTWKLQLIWHDNTDTIQFSSHGFRRYSETLSWTGHDDTIIFATEEKVQTKKEKKEENCCMFDRWNYWESELGGLSKFGQTLWWDKNHISHPHL